MITKLIAIGIIAAFFPLLVNAAKSQKLFQVNDFSKGLDSYHNSTTLPDGYVQDSHDVLFDDVSPVSKRSGFNRLISGPGNDPWTGAWTYTDSSNTTWMIVRSSSIIYAIRPDTFIAVQIATVSANNLVGETNAFGNAYFVDQSQGVYYWNGSTTTVYVSGSPRGSIISQFHNRLWVTGAAVPNGNQLYGSKYYDGTTWTTGLNDTDPVQYSVGLQDNFDNVTAEYVYLDTLYLFKHYAIYALYGFGQTSFQISQITQECGCIDGGTIQTYNGSLKFVSLRGVEDFNGYSCKRISDAVKDKVDPAIQVGGFSQVSWLQSTQADWNAGTFTPSTNLNSNVASPSLVLSTGSHTDSTTANFSAGTTVNTTLRTNQVSLALNNSGSIDNPSFESGSGNVLGLPWVGPGNDGPNFPWQRFSSRDTAYPSLCTITAQSGGAFANSGNNSTGGTGFFQVILSNGSAGAAATVLASQAITSVTNCGWTLYTINDFGDVGKRVQFQMKFTDLGNLSYYSNTNISYIFGGSISFYGNLVPNGGASIDNIQNGTSTITTGSFTSQSVDTGLTKSYATVSAYSTTNNSASPSIDIQTSSDNSTWTDLGTSTSTSYLANRYLRYVSTLTAGSGEPFLNSETFQWTASSGTFKSQIHNIGSIASWGNFSVGDIANGGSIAFSVCSSSNSNMSSPASCADQTANAQINISTHSYVQWYATFSVTAATQAPTLQSGTVQWYSGSLPIPMASTVWDNRYWLSLTTNSVDSGNDDILILNKTGAWAQFDIHARALFQYHNTLYHTGAGVIFVDNQGFSDDGSAINAYVKTKDISMGSLSADDYLYAIYPSASNTGSCAMTVQYSVDRSTVTYSLGSPLLNEFGTQSSLRLPFPIDASHQDFGQSVNFTFGTNDTSCDWQFYGAEGLSKTRVIQ